MKHEMFEGLARQFADAPASRRDVLRLAVGAGSGLVLGAAFPIADMVGPAAAQAASSAFTPFVRIGLDSKVTVLIKHLDMGQGIATGLATLVAEELDADWSQIDAEFAPANTALYKNLMFGVQGTGGSTSIANSYEQYRTAGAAARAMLIAAAAAAWKVKETDVRVIKGRLVHTTKSAAFGEFASAAARLPVPQAPKLKDPKDFVFIGKTFPRLDSRAKSTGTAMFTQDLKLPGMLVAVVAHAPKFGAKVKSVDASGAKAIKDVVDIVDFGEGVAVLAKSTWPAIKGRDALKVTWDETAAETRGSAEILAEFRKLAETPGKVFHSHGDAEAALKGAAKVIEAEYTFPYLAHAAMEPMNAAVQFKDGKATVWTGAQLQTVDQMVVGGVFGIKPDDVTVNTLWAGGSFGRRAVPGSDYIREAALIVKAWGKADPVKLVWTREDDTKAGYYRPMVLHKVRAGLDAAGNIVGWQHRIVGQSLLIGTPFEPMMVKNGIDATVVEGVEGMPYTIASFSGDVHQPKVGVPVLWWRSVGHTHTAYVVETMIDELAQAAGKDPVAFRLALLEKHPRHAAVLELAAEKAGWGKPLPDGLRRGVAVHESFGSRVAQVVEVRMAGGRPKVERVVAAVDIGLAVNPDIVAAQVEGAIGFGLGAVLHSKITLKNGEVEQGNFDGYEVLRLDEMPKVEVHILPSTDKPTGIGEPGTPPIGPAVANAVAALTGKRVRELPFDDGLKRAG